jgi:O-antigen ligase
MIKKILLTSPVLYFLILPFLFFPGLPDSFELPKIILFISTIYIYISFYILGIITKEIEFVKLSKAFYLFILFAFILTIGSFINGLPVQSLWGQYFRYQGLLTFYCYGLFLILFGYILHSENRIKQIQKIISLSSIGVCVLIIFQFILYYLLNFPIYTYNGRLTGFFGNPNFAAFFLVLSFPYAFFFIETSFVKNKNMFLSIYFILLITSLIFTASRSGIFVFAILMWIIFIEKSKKLLGLLIIPFMSIFLILFSFRDINSVESRPLIWQRGFSAFLQKPFFGWGVENFETAITSQYTLNDVDLKNIRIDKAHNESLEILVSSGVIGYFVFLFLLLFMAKILYKNRESIWGKANFYAFIAYVILSQLNVLNLTSYFFFYLILSSILIQKKKD